MTARWNSSYHPPGTPLSPCCHLKSIPFPTWLSNFQNINGPLTTKACQPREEEEKEEEEKRRKRKEEEEEEEDFFFSHSLFILVLVFLELTL